MANDAQVTRRSLLVGLSAAASVAIIGCGRASSPGGNSPESARPGGTSAAVPAAAMTVYKDPSCGCCEAWAGIAREAGYEVTVVDHPDMRAIKAKYGVPEALLSCHTTIVGGYVIEGHVPLEDVQRLLAEKPGAIRGIAVAGMPLGSPGMEVPDGTKQPFQVMAFDKGGRVSVFRG